MPFGTVLGSVFDLLVLRLSLPLQSRPAQISDGTQDSTDERELCLVNVASASCPRTTDQGSAVRTPPLIRKNRWRRWVPRKMLRESYDRVSK